MASALCLKVHIGLLFIGLAEQGILSFWSSSWRRDSAADASLLLNLKTTGVLLMSLATMEMKKC
jgi:hypothetical protein